MPKSNTEIVCRRNCAGSYSFRRVSDGALIAEAEQGVLHHDPRSWLVTYYRDEGEIGWVQDDNSVAHRLRDAKLWAKKWATTLAETGDRGWVL